jgi:hypothetical protein
MKFISSFKNTLTIFFLLISGLTFSQEDEPTKQGRIYRIGLVGGANFTSNTNPEVKTTTAYYFGAINDMQIAPSLKFQSGLWYVRNGGTLKDKPYKLRLNYIQIPTLAKVKIGPIYALTGFTTSYRVAAVFVDGDDEIKANKNNFKRFDFGFQLGGGFKTLFFSVEARYNWGLSNIVKDGSGDFKNRYFQLGVNVMLPRF